LFGISFRLIAAVAPALGVAGCGGFFGQDPSLVLGDVDQVETVTLDWSGGISDLYPDLALAGLDFGKFALADGGTLADYEEKFKAAVLEEIVAILDELPEGRVHVRNGRAEGNRTDTIIHVAQSFSPEVGGQIGQAIYDPCDRYSGDAGIIYGDEILQTGGPFHFGGWVAMFANVTAHEIAHTLGYGHVERRLNDGVERPLYVELMLAIHTIPEMISPQRYLADDGNCPGTASAKQVTPPPDFICRIGRE
jgi:hypothetical protein